MQLIIHMGGVRRHFYIRRGIFASMRGHFEKVSVLRPFASHLISFSAEQAPIFADFAAECAGIASEGQILVQPHVTDAFELRETLFYIKFHMYTLVCNLLFESLSSSVWQRQTALWLCGISRKRSDRRICSERIKSSQSLNSLCITVRQAEMFSLSLSLSLSKLHGRRARAIITWSTQFA
jgi:hypothetical protein